MNAVDLLKARHRQMERDLARWELASKEQKAIPFERFADTLATHTQLEQHLYSVVAAKTGGSEKLSVQQRSHAGIARVMADLLRVGVNGESFATGMTVLREIVRRHIRKDESDFFPRLRRILSKDDLEALGNNLESEIVRLNDRGSPRLFFDKQKALVLGERPDGQQAGGLKASAFR